MLNRRNFIKTTLAGSAFLALPTTGRAFFGHSPERIVILHTSDLHSQIDPFPDNHSRFPGMGGFARRAALISSIRKENQHVLLLDSGDIFQGTPYYNFYEGRLELQLMSKMGYDASTLGNHEFDNGMESLSQQLPHATFPFVSTNYQVENTVLEGKTKPWIVIQKGKIKIGIVGLGIDPNGLVNTNNYAGLKYLDPIATGDETARMLKKNQKCHYVIALSHLGYKMSHGRVDDLTLAADTRHIDLILGGHSHRTMEEPEYVINKAGKPVAIIHSGASGVRLGRIDLVFDKGETRLESNPYQVKN